ncbi:poly(3-hydroxyalkanoate) depolymerase [Chitinophaga sp. Mgbs1]|uniref:Poly(3-hydroxyalkanoate) depolymerase n=1 Tax=Chitinophaga solisilvae TaxID=1233460 RepID=A0A433WK35_9BACT|nr:poly(3-hydroxyalkanoate) depolymerase [Chitinophaga solisilvae]
MKSEIIHLITQILIEIIPDLADADIDPNESFVKLGANSVDRGELIALTIERLDLNIFPTELASAQTVNELADLIEEKG